MLYKKQSNWNLKTNWVDSIIETIEDRISEREDRTIEVTQSQQKEKTH